jgi:phospholipid/cholesterol/gamma-HCH transport system substrate-binding protein
MALKSFRDRNPIFVGLVCVTVLALAITVTFLTGTLGLLKSRYTMSGIFADTGGLRSGQDVEVAGVKVGQITAVKPDFRRGHVLITWTVDSYVKLGPKTRAEIRMNNVLGGRYLRLSGPVGAPYMDDLPERDRRVPLDRTMTPTTVNDVLKTTSNTLNRLDSKTISRVLTQLKDVSQRGHGRLGHALQTLALLAESINESDPQIKSLLENGDRLIKLVNSKDRELSQLVRNAQVLLNELRARQAELGALLGSGSNTVRSLSRLVTDQQGELDSIVNDLGATMTTLQPQTAAMNDLLSRIGPTMTAFSGIASKGPWVDAIFSQIGPLSASDLQGLTRMLETERTAQ